jgi:hypothetical protein
MSFAFLLKQIKKVNFSKHEFQKISYESINLSLLSFSWSWFWPHLVHSDNAGNRAKKPSCFSIDLPWECEVKSHWGIQYQSHSINYQLVKFFLLV